MYSNYEAPNDYRSYLAHHGVKGMKWGVRHEQARKARIMKKYGLSSEKYDDYNSKLQARKKRALSSRGGPGGTPLRFSRKAQYGILSGFGGVAGGIAGNIASRVAGAKKGSIANIAATIGGAAIGSIATTAPTAVGNHILDSIWSENELTGGTNVVANAYMNYRDKKRLNQ